MFRGSIDNHHHHHHPSQYVIQDLLTWSTNLCQRWPQDQAVLEPKGRSNSEERCLMMMMMMVMIMILIMMLRGRISEGFRGRINQDVQRKG
eukprot:3436698-Karenia_brevis.AAC.1